MLAEDIGDSDAALEGGLDIDMVATHSQHRDYFQAGKGIQESAVHGYAADVAGADHAHGQGAQFLRGLAGKFSRRREIVDLAQIEEFVELGVGGAEQFADQQHLGFFQHLCGVLFREIE
jgi:hypothetical protein